MAQASSPGPGWTVAPQEAREARVPVGSDLELRCQGVAGPLQGGGVQALLVAFQTVPVFRLLHCFIHILEDFPALVPGPAELLVLRGATCPRGNEGFLGLLPDESARA